MAEFFKAYLITMDNEGGYNPGVGEKETYKGIDRGQNPHWDGWEIIDSVKKENPGIKVADMNRLLAQIPGLQDDIAKFYKANYCDVVALDKVNDQQLANNLFDCSVNQGSGIAARFMQKACNEVIDTVGSKMVKLAVDGVIGLKTLATFNSLAFPKLNVALNSLRRARYEESAQYAEWGHVWLKRLTNYV